MRAVLLFVGGDRAHQSRQARLAAARLLGLSSATWAVAASGKPGIAGRPDCHVSLSHSGGWIAAAAGYGGPVGVDVEAVGKQRSCGAIARACFTEAEIDLVDSRGEWGFYACWTLREAIAKCLSTGLAGALRLGGGHLCAVGGEASVEIEGRIMHLAHAGGPKLHAAMAWLGTDSAAAFAPLAAAVQDQR